MNRCPNCESERFTPSSLTRSGKQRYECRSCRKTWSESTGKLFHRNRIPERILCISIFFHIFIPARIVKIFLFFLFGCNLSESSICFWSRKFLDQHPELQRKGTPSEIVIRHTDEKYLLIRGQRAYWWNTTDPQGNLLTSSISMVCSMNTTKQHLKKHKKIEAKIDVHVTDGMNSYPKATRMFGRKTTHVIAGLQEKIFMHNKKILSVSNLPVERLNSKVDAYIKLKYRGSFTNFLQADRSRKAFMLTQLIQEHVRKQECIGTPPTAPNEHTLMELLIPNTKTLLSTTLA